MDEKILLMEKIFIGQNHPWPEKSYQWIKVPWNKRCVEGTSKSLFVFNPNWILFHFIAKLHKRNIISSTAVVSYFHFPRPSLGTFNYSDMPRLDTCYKESHLHF